MKKKNTTVLHLVMNVIYIKSCALVWDDSIHKLHIQSDSQSQFWCNCRKLQDLNREHNFKPL